MEKLTAPLSRKTLVFSTSAAAAAVFALRFRRNQVAARQPSRYVTVDRSGGGV